MAQRRSLPQAIWRKLRQVFRSLQLHLPFSGSRQQRIEHCPAKERKTQKNILQNIASKATLIPLQSITNEQKITNSNAYDGRRPDYINEPQQRPCQ